jgi:hypothetical protein
MLPSQKNQIAVKSGFYIISLYSQNHLFRNKISFKRNFTVAHNQKPYLPIIIKKSDNVI